MKYEDIVRDLENVLSKEKGVQYSTFSLNVRILAESCLSFIQEQQKLLPKKGKWEWLSEECGNPFDGIEYDEGYQCSVCKYDLPDALLHGEEHYDIPTAKFCPNCGADMRDSNIWFSLKDKLEREGSAFTVEEAQKLNDSVIEQGTVVDDINFIRELFHTLLKKGSALTKEENHVMNRDIERLYKKTGRKIDIGVSNKAKQGYYDFAFCPSCGSSHIEKMETEFRIVYQCQDCHYMDVVSKVIE